MTDHLTNAILAAARLDDATAVDQLGYLVDLDNPHAIAHVTEGRPSLRASMERGGYLAPDHDDGSAIDLLLRAQTEAEPERHYATLARRGFPLLADVAQRSREALDATCTCGSGGNPRRCARHPDAYDAHITEMNRENDADDAAEAVGPFPSPTVTSHPATFGARLTSPPFSFDDLPPDVARAAGIIGGWIDPAAEARRDVAAKARAMMADGDIAGAVGVLVASYDANGSPVEEP